MTATARIDNACAVCRRPIIFGVLLPLFAGLGMQRHLRGWSPPLCDGCAGVVVGEGHRQMMMECRVVFFDSAALSGGLA